MIPARRKFGASWLRKMTIYRNGTKVRTFNRMYPDEKVGVAERRRVSCNVGNQFVKLGKELPPADIWYYEGQSPERLKPWYQVMSCAAPN